MGLADGKEEGGGVGGVWRFLRASFGGGGIAQVVRTGSGRRAAGSRASDRGGSGKRSGGGAGRGGVGGSRPRNDNPGDSFGFGTMGSPRSHGDPGDAHHPGHSRTNPRAARLHDDTDGAIPQGPGQREGAAGGGGKWWERAKGWNGEGGSDGGVFHPLFRDGFVRSDRHDRHDRRGAFHGGYAPPEGADTSPPGEGEFGDDGDRYDRYDDGGDEGRRRSGDGARFFARHSEPPKFDDDETMDEYVARRAYADSFGMTGHDRSLGDGEGDAGEGDGRGRGGRGRRSVAERSFERGDGAGGVGVATGGPRGGARGRRVGRDGAGREPG